MKKYDGKGGSRSRHNFPIAEKLQVGQRIHDTRGNQDGVILDIASQYAHPKAAPVFSYLMRWDDGQVQAIAEASFTTQSRYEIID